MVFGFREQPPLKHAVTVDDFPFRTIPADPRFPNQNQTRHCFVSYVDFQRCQRKHDENYPACQYYKEAYTTMCPLSWIEKWDTQIAEGRFPAKLD